jgi:hypothetical protein
MLKRLSHHRRAPQPLLKLLNRNGPRLLSFPLLLAPLLAAFSIVADAFFSASDLALISNPALKVLSSSRSLPPLLVLMCLMGMYWSRQLIDRMVDGHLRLFLCANPGFVGLGSSYEPVAESFSEKKFMVEE